MASYRKKKPDNDPRLWLGPSLPMQNVVKIPTGWYLLDKIILSGGIQTGMVTEVVSREGGGKTLFCMRVSGHAQRMGLRVAWADAEYYIKPGVQQWFERQGVSFSDLIVFGRRPSGFATLEDTFEDCKRLLLASEANPVVVKRGKEEQRYWADVIVIDSLAALQPQAVIEKVEGGKSLDEATKIVGERAKMIGAFLSLLSEIVIQQGKLLLCCNQVRANFTAGWGGNPYRPWGGQELAHRLDMRISLEPGEKIREGGAVVGQKTKCRVFKNRIGANFVSTGTTVPDLAIYYDGRSLGIEHEIIEAALFFGVVRRSGAWYYLGDEKAKGKDGLLKLVMEHGLLDSLERQVAEKVLRPDDDKHQPTTTIEESTPEPVNPDVDSWVTEALDEKL